MKIKFTKKNKKYLMKERKIIYKTQNNNFFYLSTTTPNRLHAGKNKKICLKKFAQSLFDIIIN